MKWCDHLKYENGELWLEDYPVDYEIQRWSFCPFCGVSRPAEIKIER